ncbi:MAG: hypothetical protein K2Z81_07725 [Cyanobacteria bacterium]|nr:hypothetical protein [Cyanobacteriota bacterium]
MKLKANKPLSKGTSLRIKRKAVKAGRRYAWSALEQNVGMEITPLSLVDSSVTKRNPTELAFLHDLSRPLIDQRNKLIDQPGFLYDAVALAQVDKIDRQLDQIEMRALTFGQILGRFHKTLEVLESGDQKIEGWLKSLQHGDSLPTS